MATLTGADYQEIRQVINSDATIKAVFKAWGLSKQTWYAVYQAVEDWVVNGFATQPASSLKVAIDAVVGTSTNAQARKIVLTWIRWRFGKDL